MKAYKTAKFDDILADATTKEKRDFLKKLAKTAGLVDKKTGEPRRITYLEIKRKYFEEYYPELLPVAKAPKKDKTIYDMIAEL